MTTTAAADVMNLAEAVAVAWRPRPDGDARLTYVEREQGADSVFEYRPEIDASERIAAFNTRIGGRFGDVDWGPDGRHLAYVRAGDIRVYDTAAQAEATLSPSDAFDSAPRFGPDGERLAFVSGRGDAGNDVWLVDRDGGEPTRVTTGANPHDDKRWAPSWSPDGDRLAYVAAHEWAGHDWADEVHIVRLADGTDDRLTRGLTVSSVPTWSPDGERLAVFATRAAEPWYRQSEDVHLIDPTTGEATVHRVEASHQYFQQSPLWSPDGRTLYYPVRNRGEQHLEALLVDPEAHAHGVPTRVTTHDGVFGAGPVTLAPDGDRFGFVYAEHDRPAHPRTLPTRGGASECVRDPEVPDGVVVPENITVESFDGAYINAYLFRPPDATEADPAPALVQCHGGGHFQFGTGWHPLEQYLAANGFAVLAIDFRGSGGYDRPFQELSMDDWHGGQIKDARAAAAFARDLPFTTDAVGIYGQSWGGLMTMHSITQFPDDWDAAVEWYGVVDQVGDYDVADRVGRLLRERDLGGGPEEAPERYRQASTDWRLDRIDTPLAVLHGAEDERVPVQQAELLRDELGERDELAFEATIYADEGHGFRDAETRRDAAERTREWFDRHLR
jgi:dipeptidyl aminopeptidase/acylaminoacyl peptidase